MASKKKAAAKKAAAPKRKPAQKKHAQKRHAKNAAGKIPPQKAGLEPVLQAWERGEAVETAADESES